MATNDAGLPSMAKISVIGIWVETVLYGINCVMYALSMFVLLRGDKTTLRWPLVVTSTILFLLCTVHVGASLRQLLDGFIYAPAGVPDYSTLYWLDFHATPRVLKDNLYVTLVFASQAILVWRLHAVFMHDWRVTVLPILLCIGCVGSAYASVAVATLPNNVDVAEPSLLLSAWVVGFILNLSVTLAIAGRLWWTGRRMASLTSSSTNRFRTSVYVAVESGVMSAIVNVAVLALSKNVAALAGLDAASQLLASAPMLIVLQLGLARGRGFSSGEGGRRGRAAQDAIVFRRGPPPEEDEDGDLSPLRTAPSPYAWTARDASVV